MFSFKLTMCLSIVILCFLYNVEISVGIIGAFDSDFAEFPYMVSLRNETNLHYCGGSLITNRHILTAARCLYTDRSALYYQLEEMYDPKVLKVVIDTEYNGWADGQCIRVRKLTPHPDFNVTNNQSVAHDIAVIEMHRGVRDVRLKPISLPTEAVTTRHLATVIGWGVFYRTGKNDFDLNKMALHLQKAYTLVIPKQDCINNYLEKIPEHANTTTAVRNGNAFCCEDSWITTCFRDSGGPLVQNRKLVGIVIVTNECRHFNPSIFTSVYHYLDFIRLNIDDELILETEKSMAYKCSEQFARPSPYNF